MPHTIVIGKPRGEYFMMTVNRSDPDDSRFWCQVLRVMDHRQGLRDLLAAQMGSASSDGLPASRRGVCKFPCSSD